MKKEDVIDLGKWTTPRSWDELTLKQFQEIERYYSDKDKKFDVREVLELFTDHSKDEIGQLPIEFVDKLLNELIWLKDTPKWDNPTNKVEINGEIYQVNTQEKLKTGEYIAVDTIIRSDKYDYASILAVLCRKKDEIFDLKFENEELEKRIKMWEEVPVVKVMPIVNFFFECWLASQKNTQLYSMVEELISLTRSNLENSHKDGVLSKRSMKSLERKLRKLEKSIKSI